MPSFFTQQKTCNQCKNAIAWANRSGWIHHSVLQYIIIVTILLCSTCFLYFRRTPLSGHLHYTVSWLFAEGDGLIEV